MMGSFYRSSHELVFVFELGTAPNTNTVELGRQGRAASCRPPAFLSSISDSPRPGFQCIDL